MRWTMVILALAFSVGSIKIAANPQVRRPVKHFIHYYREQQGAEFVPRTVNSWLLAERY
jgi:hypothetical protein